MPFLRKARSADRPADGLTPLLPPAPGAPSRPDAPPRALLDQVVTGQDVERLLSLFMGRTIKSPAYRAEKVRAGVTLAQLTEEIIHSPEFFSRFTEGKIMPGSAFRVPRQLIKDHTSPKNVFIIGSCALDVLHEQLSARGEPTTFTKFTFNNGSSLPPLAVERASEVDFQIVQLPIRAIMPEHMYFGEPRSEEQARAWFQVSSDILRLNFEAAMKYNQEQGIQTFFLNFLSPQQNSLGRLQPAYNFDNPVFYVNELNRLLSSLISQRINAFYIDIDGIANSLGKRFIQDDSVTHLNHGSYLTGITTGADINRLEPVGSISQIYSPRVEDFNAAVYDDILAAWRSIRQSGSIKLVIFDLDDTLWRGVAAERIDDLDIEMTEGWPLGVLEALNFLHQRGILVSIVSKNDLENVRRIWTELYESRFSFESFVLPRINWDSKSKNIQDIVSVVNVGQDQVLFVDDNPVERARIRADLPAIRVLEAPLAEWRRILLWSAELQPARITSEGLGRAASVRAKDARDAQAQSFDKASFLADLHLKIAPKIVSTAESAQFARCHELLNKTNQFNTTGQRWSEAELRRLLLEGGWLLTFLVQDRHANYGLTAIAVCKPGQIIQVVMSCRVFGLGVEETAMALTIAHAREKGAAEIAGVFSDTGRNHLSADLFESCGFEPVDGGLWRLPVGAAMTVPAHVCVVETT